MATFRKLGTDFTDGLQSPHYSNGRLLTAEDLQREQRATLERLAQLGKGFAAGVIEGLRVSAVTGSKNLQVTAGSGINRNGNLVRLVANTVTLPVQPVPVATGSPLRRSDRFEGCSDDINQPSSAPVATGAYLLTVAPLARLEGTVPRRAPSGTETSTCANQWEVEGVEFKIIRLDAYQRPTGSRSKRNRNLLAHWVYGSSKLTRLMLELFHFDPDYTGYAALPPEDYTACDLPLAVFFWENNSIAFVDEWAVRRRLSHPHPTRSWRANLSDQRVAEGEARFLQFQEQLDSLRTAAGSKTSSIRAADHFAYLPPVGFLPVNPFELIVDDVFAQSISDEQEARIARLQLTLAQVRDRVRTAVISSLGTTTVFRLDRFFEDVLPDTYQIVHEDEVHDQLQLSWVKAPITLPAPPVGPVVTFPGLFELVMPDEFVLEVTDDNISSVVANLAPSHTVMMSAFSTGTAAAAEEEPTLAGEVNLPLANAFVTRFATRNMSRAARRPLAVEAMANFVLATNIDDETPPLVNILVIDQLLEPYREYLAGQMPGRIDTAITSLSSGGGSVFTGSNIFANVNNTIHNTFMLNNFLSNAMHTGIANVGALSSFKITDPLPPFYVVFVRHIPARRSRPLRSGQ